jgi:ribosomal protein S18 acetylase RimI-like enzyme
MDLAMIEALFEELDALHRERIPERFRASSGPARSPDYLLEVIRGPDTAFLIAEDSGEVLGLVHLALRSAPELPMFVPRQLVIIENLVVAKRAQRRGIGRALMTAADEWAHEHRANSIELTVYEANEEGTAFYRALGYRVLSYRLSREIA